jgi:hypothetical protein
MPLVSRAVLVLLDRGPSRVRLWNFLIAYASLRLVLVA